MEKKEFEYRKQINDRFLLTVLDSKTQVIIDKDNLMSDHTIESEAELESESDSLAPPQAVNTGNKELSPTAKTKGKK